MAGTLSTIALLPDVVGAHDRCQGCGSRGDLVAFLNGAPICTKCLYPHPAACVVAAPDISFEPRDHSYTDNRNGRRSISVTSNLSRANLTDYSRIPRKDAEYYMYRGKAVGEAIAQVVQRRFDWTYLRRAPDFAPYILAGLLFLREAPFIPLIVESIVFVPTLGVCGTLDLAGLFGRTKPAILDWKCTEAQRATAVQTAGYALGLPSLNGLYEYANDHHLRIGVPLLKDGRYGAPQFYDDATDQNLFFAASLIARWQDG